MPIRSHLRSVVTAAGFALVLLIAVVVSRADNSLASSTYQQGPTSTESWVQQAVVVPPGEVVEIPFRSYCLDVNRFPPQADELGTLRGLADQRVLKVLGKAIEQDLVNAATLRERFQPQYAMWSINAEPESVFCLDFVTGAPIGDAQSGALLDFASGPEPAPAFPSEPANATPLNDLVSSGQLAVAGYEFAVLDSRTDPLLPSCFTEQLRGRLPDRRFAGEGTIQVRNPGDQPITTYLPYGTVIEPRGFNPNTSRVQRLVVYSVQPGPTPGPTEVVTPTLAPTEVVTPTTGPTDLPTDTPTPSSGVEPTVTPSPTPTPDPIPGGFAWCLPCGLILLLILLIVIIVLLLRSRKRKKHEQPAAPIESSEKKQP